MTCKALIVASGNYTDPGLRSLRAPANDALGLAAVLRDPEIGGFDVLTLLNEPAHVINLAVEDFFADRRPDDLLVVYFSGHGVKAEDGELYFATSGTVLERLGATAVSAEFVSRQMGRSRSGRVVLLLDCCYAGTFGRGLAPRAGLEIGVKERFGGGNGRAVITASSAMEYAFEAGELADDPEVPPSVFTSTLIAGLQSGEADQNQDGVVGLNELYDYVYDKVRAVTPNRTPGMWTFGMEGELYIARRARPVTMPAPLPPALQQAIDDPMATVRVGAVQELAELRSGRHSGMSLTARLALEKLTEDDSRTVAAAATAALRAPADDASQDTILLTKIDAVPADLTVTADLTVPADLDTGQGGKPARSRRYRRLGLAILGGAVAAVGLAIAVVIFSKTPGRHDIPPAPRASATPSATVSMDAAYGHLRWSYATGNSVVSSPTVVDGIVYVGSWDDSVYALNATTGKVRWAYRTGGKVESSPAVVDGTVYVGSGDGKVYALNATNGHRIWAYRTGDYVYSSPAVVDGTVYVGSRDHRVYALNATNGKVLWTYTALGWVNSSPMVLDGTVYVGSGDGRLYALDAVTGSLLWKYGTADWVDSSPTMAAGIVYVGSRDGKVYALNAETGGMLWAYPTGGQVFSSPAVAAGIVYVGSRDGKVYALNAATGHRIWAYRTGGYVDSSPTVAAGIVYIGSYDGKVYALNAATGRLRGIYQTGDKVRSRPTVMNGIVYVGSYDGKVYAFSAA